MMSDLGILDRNRSEHCDRRPHRTDQEMRKAIQQVEMAYRSPWNEYPDCNLPHLTMLGEIFQKQSEPADHAELRTGCNSQPDLAFSKHLGGKGQCQ